MNKRDKEILKVMSLIEEAIAEYDGTSDVIIENLSKSIFLLDQGYAEDYLEERLKPLDFHTNSNLLLDDPDNFDEEDSDPNQAA